MKTAIRLMVTSAKVGSHSVALIEAEHSRTKPQFELVAFWMLPGGFLTHPSFLFFLPSLSHAPLLMPRQEQGNQPLAEAEQLQKAQCDGWMTWTEHRLLSHPLDCPWWSNAESTRA
jgi:hypothetical protein